MLSESFSVYTDSADEISNAKSLLTPTASTTTPTTSQCLNELYDRYDGSIDMECQQFNEAYVLSASSSSLNIIARRCSSDSMLEPNSIQLQSRWV